MKRLLLCAFVVVFGFAGAFCPVHAAPDLIAAVPNAIHVPAYDLFELTMKLYTTYANPFDPDQIDVGADFTGPRGAKMHVNGFWYQAFTRSLSAVGKEVDAAAGVPVWKIRFAPDRPGIWRYAVAARDATGTAMLPQASFIATASDNPGFIRVSKRNPRAFAFAGEKPFFAVGEDMAWGGPDVTYSYDRWMPKLHEAGGNWARIWCGVAPDWATLEWTDTGEFKSEGEQGLGAYDLDSAWRLDQIFDGAQRNDIYCMLTLDHSVEMVNTLAEGREWELWPDNPYNVANGGPCKTPADFFTNPLARKYYERRLRYVAARYGWRTNIQSWEFWNEAPDLPTAWVQEMAQYLEGAGLFAGHPADPFHHLVSTTYGNAAIWKIPQVGFTQSHLYGDGNNPDLAPEIVSDAHAFESDPKPHMDSEFGIDANNSDQYWDPHGTGVDLHNGIWAAAASGDAGTAMLWWWDSYVDPANLYSEFTPIARVAAQLPWTAGPWTPVKFSTATVNASPETYSDLVLKPTTPWEQPTLSVFDIRSAGDALSYSWPTFIFGPSKGNWQRPVRILVDYPAAGRFIIHVDQVATLSVLRISLDGRQAATFTLDAVPPADPSVKPTYKSPKHMTDYNYFLATFDQDYVIDVPAGKHVIELDNIKGDHLSVSYYRLTGYTSNRFANLRLTGIRTGRTAFLWIQNAAHDWRNVYDGAPIPTIRGAKTSVYGMPAGAYSVEYIDTSTGDPIETVASQTTSTAGELPLKLPDIATDVAVVITPEPSDARRAEMDLRDRRHRK